MKTNFKNSPAMKILSLWLFCVFAIQGMAQDLPETIVMQQESHSENTIKSSSEKLSDKPQIADTIKKIEKINYNITSKPVATAFTPGTITPAKMVNEPLSKLYHCLIKVGMGNYTTPYAEIFINNLRSKESAYGFRYKHLSSSARLKNTGFAGFSDNEFYLNGKKFFKRHTLSGDFNYLRNSNHFYGLDTANWEGEKDFTRQVFNTLEAKVNLVSHFTDSAKLNHDVNLDFYNLTDKYKLNESNISANGLVRTFIMKEKFNVYAAVDYYNHKMSNDTVNNTIIRLNPYFEAGGKKWSADIGILAAIDKFSDSSAKFYFYPRLNVSYNVYNNIIIPYAGITGDLQKNSFRNLVQVNPFLVSTPELRNTNKKFEVFGGLRGALSSKTNYDANVSYQRVDNLAMYLIDYSDALKNRFTMVYDDANVLRVGGQIKYSHKEKINIIGSGNYYRYDMSAEKYAWHRPSFDIKLSGTYNIKSKIITRMDLYFIGNQWALQKSSDVTGATVALPVNLKGIADLNLGVEYRYSKFLSGFVNFNNIANMRYYRWDRYPTQRFNLMVGVTFIPF
jgi:hypothetical protein